MELRIFIEPQQGIRYRGVLIEPGRNPDRVGKAQPECLDPKPRLVDRRRQQRHDLQRLYDQRVGILRVERAQYRTGETIKKTEHREFPAHDRDPVTATVEHLIRGRVQDVSHRGCYLGR